MKKSHKEQISSLKQRNEFNNLFESTARLMKIHSFLHSQNKIENNEEILKYIPIAAVASFEGFCRTAIKELIDFGSPYIDNCKGFSKLNSIKFDFDIISDLNKKTFTLGEFIGHLLPCNNLDDINSNLTTILGKDFLGELKKFEKQDTGITAPLFIKDFQDDVNNIIADIKKIFELRHIFCHEVSTTFHISFQEAVQLLNSSLSFLQQMEEYIHHILMIDAAGMLHGRIEYLEKELDRLDKELKPLITSTRNMKNVNHPQSHKQSFNEFIKIWDKYISAKATWLGTKPFTGHWQYLASLESLTESKKKMVKLLSNH